MESIEKLLRQSWENIEFFENGSLQLRITHPLEWHVVYETPTNKALAIVSHYPIELDQSKCIHTTCNRRKDGMYYISFLLTDTEQEDVFINLCSNLIDFSSSTTSENTSLQMVKIRYKQWKQLMENKNISILSDEERRGLIGELFFLEKMLRTEKSIVDVLNGWVGPDGNPQDFVYDGTWYEIKTTLQSSNTITIHSLEQLGKNDDKGELIIYRIDPCAPEYNEAFTLPSIIHNITHLLMDNLFFIELFNEKLNKTGYVEIDEYKKFSYKYFSDDSYNVDSSFPKLTRNNIPVEITKCEYKISIPSISKWKKG